MSTANAQTYSNEEIIISGLGFSRFVVTLVPDENFSKNPDSSRWLRIIDRNLCWSGVFLVTDSRYQTCRNKNKNKADMKILIKLGNKTSESELVLICLKSFLNNSLLSSSALTKLPL